MNDRSVYLSYRRSFSYSIALALFHGLRSQGFDVFMDVDAFDNRDALDLGQIRARTHFLVVMAPGLIEPLQHSDDPLRREIEQAVSARRSIVPLLMSEYSFNNALLPAQVSVLRRYFALRLAPETLADALVRLNEHLLAAHFFGTLVPTSLEQQQAVERKIAEAERQSLPMADELRAEVIFNHAHLRSRQDYSGKLEDYDEVLRLNPGHLYARFDRALARRRSGDDAGAVEDYDEVLRLNSQFYKAYNNRAELYFARGNYRQALADYEQATALRPDYTMSLAGKALTFHALGQVDEAIRLWKPLMAQDERFVDAVWVGRELRLPNVMIDELHHLLLHLNPSHASDD